LENDFPDLFNLIRLCVVTLGLQIQDFDNPVPRENVMVTSNSLAKPQTLQQRTQRLKFNV